LAILSDAQKLKVKQMFEGQLQGPVQVVLFHDGDTENQWVAATREIIAGLAEVSEGRLTLREVNAAAEVEEAGRFGVAPALIPALAMLDGQGKDQGFRFYGAPAGYEFMALLDDVIDVSRGQTRLSDAARSQIRGIDQEVVIQVFSTPG
jgi:alkyl hydroperoxide reductase subunit AhpF